MSFERSRSDGQVQFISTIREPELSAEANMSLDDAFALFRQRNRANSFSVRTLEFYRFQLSSFIAFLTSMNATHLRQIQPFHLWSYLASLAERGLKDTSIHAAARAVRTFFNFCVVHKLLDHSPMRGVEMPRMGKRILPSFPSQVLPRLIAVCTRTRDTAIVMFLLDTGCRASELLNLQWRDVDLISGRVVIRGGKGRKDRIVFIGRETRQKLKAYGAEISASPNTDTPIWLNHRTRRPLTSSGLRQMLEQLGKRAGVAHCSPHTFRRTFAIESLRKGIDLYTLARLMGHSDIAVLRVYLDILEDDLVTAQHRYGIVDGLVSSHG